MSRFLTLVVALALLASVVVASRPPQDVPGRVSRGIPPTAGGTLAGGEKIKRDADNQDSPQDHIYHRVSRGLPPPSILQPKRGKRDTETLHIQDSQDRVYHRLAREVPPRIIATLGGGGNVKRDVETLNIEENSPQDINNYRIAREVPPRLLKDLRGKRDTVTLNTQDSQDRVYHRFARDVPPRIIATLGGGGKVKRDVETLNIEENSPQDINNYRIARKVPQRSGKGTRVGRGVPRKLYPTSIG